MHPLSTCVAILAVDFRIFPRRFAKTETYGTGLMDVGVGGFVLSNALVVPERAARVALRRALPLLALGAATLAGKRGVDYWQHVSEYGVHWNFFFTLAGVALRAAGLRARRAPRCARDPALGARCSRHTGLCSRARARDWALRAPRVGLRARTRRASRAASVPPSRGAARSGPDSRG